MTIGPKPDTAHPEDDHALDPLWERRLEREREREELMKHRARKDMMHGTPLFPEFWLEKILNLTGLRTCGEANARDFQLGHVEFRFDNLPSAFDGFRILHLTDPHFRENDPESTEKLCELIRPVEADFCAFTGDYRYAFTGPYEHVLESMQRVMDTIDPVYGSVAVLGNHDIAAFVPPFRKMGLRVLINEHFPLDLDGERIWCAGVDDPHYYECADLSGALAGVPREDFAILFAHSPELAEIAPSYGIDFYLCGHTHCGQVCFPGGFAPIINARAPRKYCFRQWRNACTQGYTSPGLGTTEVAVRFFCPPEATIITLKRTE
ncbi:MAG: metallophosphoesterase [Candidatus Hydrogenedentota bacterium]